MKALFTFCALAILFTLTACGDRFDAEAEKEAVVAVSVGLDEDMANADREAAFVALHEDLTGFTSAPDAYASWTYQDLGPDWLSEPEVGRWDDYDVFVAPDLAVIEGDRTYQHPVYGPVKQFNTSVFTKEDGEWKLIHTHISYAGP